MPGVDDRVARRAELGTIVGIYPVKPDWFEGDARSGTLAPGPADRAPAGTGVRRQTTL